MVVSIQGLPSKQFQDIKKQSYDLIIHNAAVSDYKISETFLKARFLQARNKA